MCVQEGRNPKQSLGDVESGDDSRMTEQELRKAISNFVADFHKTVYREQQFIPGKTEVRYAGRCFDETEMQAAVEACLDFWLTEGRFVQGLQNKLAEKVGVKSALLVNSGSSANLLAISALTSHKLGKHRLKPGDEIITAAAGFPTTVNPIILNGFVPVFVDVAIPTYNAKAEEIEKAVGPKTRAIFLAHTLGNPFDLNRILEICQRHELYLIEDNCDALGSRYYRRNCSIKPDNFRFTGSFGILSTCSFYPAHHMTTGEGGAVLTSDKSLAEIVRSFKDWGRDCYCGPGESNKCKKRFSGRHGELPYGYDHKYVYSHIGYNLKMTDMQAAIGFAQINKLDMFCRVRRENFRAWKNGFKELSQYFILPENTEDADPAWFAFPITVRKNAGFTRTELTTHLNQNKIETRNLFAGNLLKQPAYMNIPRRQVDDLENTNRIMDDTFFLGTYPGLGKEQISYTMEVLHGFLKSI